MNRFCFSGRFPPGIHEAAALGLLGQRCSSDNDLVKRKTTQISRRLSGEKHKEIVDAGRRVMFREGIWNTTTRKIAEEAGISLATIHYYFANKDELLVAVYEEMIDSIRQYAAQDFSEPSTLAERIEGVVEVSWQFSEKNMEAQLMQAELSVYALRNGMQALATRQGREYLDVYVRVLQSASDVKERRGLDIIGLAQLILAGIDGVLVQHMSEPDNARSARTCRKLIEVALHYPLTAGDAVVTPLTLSKQKRSGRSRLR
jgi:AcrR family transcriptional regulator